jgi:hypothetical protein
VVKRSRVSSAGGTLAARTPDGTLEWSDCGEDVGEVSDDARSTKSYGASTAMVDFGSAAKNSAVFACLSTTDRDECGVLVRYLDARI